MENDIMQRQGTAQAADQDNMEQKYAHIKGWGIDADPDNEPTYPMKKYTGDDHQRIHYNRPPLQPVNTEVLHSNERPNVTAAFGTSCPPSGLSGSIRRKAFEYSEGQWRHWLMLILADRVNMVEGIIDDFKNGHIPNIIAERGWTAEWKYNRKNFVKNMAIGVAVTAAIGALLYNKNLRKAISGK